MKSDALDGMMAAQEWADSEKIETALEVTLPEIHYDTSRQSYWIKNRRGGWITVSETSVRRHLKEAGVAAKSPSGGMSDLERMLNKIQTDYDVQFAGALAGYPTGIAEMYGQRVLVTSAPKIIEPKSGEWPILNTLFSNMLCDPEGIDQRPYYYGWLKIAYEALRAEIRRPGQALAIAGPRNSGKSLAQRIITEILGGRAAKPYRYMSGTTDFNAELCGAEHLMIEDEVAYTDMQRRRQFGTKIKDFTVNQTQSLHRKGVTAISVEPFWRLSITLNDEPEDLLILPPIDDSLTDKIILLKASCASMPMPTRTPDEREAFWKTLCDELPAFLFHLLNWDIPEELRSHRFGIAHFHHPDLLHALSDMAPEFRLLELIDNTLWAEDPAARVKPAYLTAVELEGQLCAGPCAHAARSLLNWQGAAGTYLARLAKSRPKRVRRARKTNERLWNIYPPEDSPSGQPNGEK